MEHQQLTRGLEQLADEAETRPVDVSNVITKAKARTKSRQTALAAGGATVVLVGALAVVTVNSGANQEIPTAGSLSTTSHTLPRLPRPGIEPAADDRSEKLDAQFDAARPELISPQFDLEPSTEAIPGHPPLKFSVSPGPSGQNYHAIGVLRDVQGSASIQLWVLKNPPGTELRHYQGQTFGPCALTEERCDHRTLPDGTKVAVQTNARPPGLTLSSTLTAQRPDGTYIQVITNVGSPGLQPPRPVPPLTADELVKFATVFTY